MNAAFSLPLGMAFGNAVLEYADFHVAWSASAAIVWTRKSEFGPLESCLYRLIGFDA